MQDTHEIWKDVVGYEELYEVSNLGRLKSKRRIIEMKNGVTRIDRPRFLSPSNSGSYVNCAFSRNGKSTTYLFHRVVAMAFLPNPENKPEVNHKDGDKMNNKSDNLEWVTRKENAMLASVNGLYNAEKGSERSNSKLTENDIPEIKRLASYGILKGTIAKKYGVNKGIIKGILNGTRWKHVVCALALLSIFSCSSNWHLKQSVRHKNIALSKGAIIKIDTIFSEKTIITKEIKKDTIFRSEKGDTVYLVKENLRIKYVKIPGDSVFIEGKCIADTLKILVPTTVTEVVNAQKSWMSFWWLFLLAGLFVGVVVSVWIRK